MNIGPLPPAAPPSGDLAGSRFTNGKGQRSRPIPPAGDDAYESRWSRVMGAGPPSPRASVEHLGDVADVHAFLGGAQVIVADGCRRSAEGAEQSLNHPQADGIDGEARYREQDEAENKRDDDQDDADDDEDPEDAPSIAFGQIGAALQAFDDAWPLDDGYRNREPQHHGRNDAGHDKQQETDEGDDGDQNGHADHREYQRQSARQAFADADGMAAQVLEGGEGDGGGQQVTQNHLDDDGEQAAGGEASRWHTDGKV